MSLLSLIPFWRRRRALKLYGQGHELLASYAYENALVTARKLRDLRFSGAYEIETRAYRGLDRLDDALRVLEEGVAFAPTVFLLWRLLGVALSDANRFDEALAAYTRAEQCAHADLSLLQLDRALVAYRQENAPRALEHLDQVSGYLYPAASLRVAVLRQLDRAEEAEQLAASTCDVWRRAEHREFRHDAGELARNLLDLRRERGEEPSALRAEAIAWWRLTRHENLLSLIRTLAPRSAPDAQHFRLVAEAQVPRGTFDGEDVKGFAVTAEVVAGTPDEALALLAELHGEPALRMSEAEVREPRSDVPKGVYWVSGRIFWDGE